MTRSASVALTLILITSATAEAAEGDDQDPDADGVDETDYGEAGSYELGGSVSLSWTSDVLAITGSPTFGIFIWDRIELSATLGFTYTRTEDEITGDHETAKAGTLVLEPSYHYPIKEELQFLAGLGVGTGYDGDDWDFELIPRVGLNIITHRSSVITPAVKVPILMGDAHGDNGDFGTSVGLVVEIGITTTW